MDTDQLIRTKRHRGPSSRKWVLSTLIAFGGLVIGFIVMNRAAPEPGFQGRPLSFHLSHLTQPPSSPDYQAATNALAQTGTKALPVLLRIIRQPEPWYIGLYFQQQTNLPKWLERQARTKLDPWSYRNRFQGAIHAVGLLGTNAAPIANELVAELPRLENSSRTPLSESLVKVGPAVVEPIKPLLTSANMRTRSLAAYICYMLNTQSAGAAPELVDGLLNGDANHQRLVGQTLARMGPDAMPVVLKLLSSTNPIMVTAGLQAVGTARLQSSQLVEKVLNQLNHPDQDTRRAAALLIAKTWPLNEGQLEEKLRHQNEENDRMSDYLESLQMIERDRDRLLAVMKEGLGGPNPQTRLTFAGELIRHQVVDDDLIAALDSLPAEVLTPELQRALQYHQSQLAKVLNAQTNSHPDTVRASRSSP